MSRYIDADALLDDVFERYCKECAKRKGSKNGKYRIICGIIYEAGDSPCRACDIDDMKTEIEDAPTIEPERKTGNWIPVSERLPWPEGHKPYLITEAHYHPEYNGRFVRIDWYDARDDEIAPMWDEHREKDGIRVVAWMPLPEPFKGGDQE